MGWGDDCSAASAYSDYGSGEDGRGGWGASSYDQEWIPFSQTLVVHPRGVIGFIMGLLSLTPFAVIIGLLTLIFFRRDLHTIFLLIGLLLNSVVNVVLKNIIQQERPSFNEHIKKYHGDKHGYGMPSHHSQFMWFFAFYMVLFLMFRMKSVNPRNPLEAATKQLWMWGLLLLAAAASYSRVFLGYHTLEQVIVGAIVGTIMASLWFYFIQHYASPCFLKILCNPWAQYFMLRDTTLIPNVLMFEYCNIQKAVRHRANIRSGCTDKGSVLCSSQNDAGGTSCDRHKSCF